MGKTINQLSAADAVAAGDQLVIYQSNSCDARKVPISAVRTFCNDGVTATDDKETQSAAPVTGATVTVTPGAPGGSVFLMLLPAGTLAALTIVIPGVGSAAGAPDDRQEVMVSTTNTVTALTISAGTTTVNGPPTTVTALAPFRMRYDATNSLWTQVR